MCLRHTGLSVSVRDTGDTSEGSTAIRNIVLFQSLDQLYTSDVHRRQIMTSEVDPLKGWTEWFAPHSDVVTL